MTDTMTALAMTIAKRVGGDMAESIRDANKEIMETFLQGTSDITDGIWSEIEEHIYAELRKSTVSLWMTDGEIEFMFWFGENSNHGLSFKIDELSIPIDPTEWAADHDAEELQKQISFFDDFIAKLRSHKVALEAARHIATSTQADA